MSDNVYDAIVIGSGISGGWAAKELTEKGLKTIMLERGMDIVHIKDYTEANKEAWDYPHRGSHGNRPSPALIRYGHEPGLLSPASSPRSAQ